MKYFFKLLFFLSFFILFYACKGEDKNQNKRTINEKFCNIIDSPDILRFIVISDTHFGNENAKEKVYNSLKNLLSKHDFFDAILVLGDLTEWGSASQYDDLKEVFDLLVPASIPTYFMMGNHDHYSESPVKIYREKLGQEELHHYVTIKDYPFVTFSLKGMYPKDFTEEDKGFLIRSFADAEKNFPGKPIFFFTHIGMTNTVYGTDSVEGKYGTNILEPILIQYPQIIAFSGYSHFPLGDPRSIHQNIFTSVNCGSTSYCEFESGFSEGIHPPYFQDISEGIIVNVKESGDVEIERWDALRNKEILPKWIIKAPHDGTQFHYKDRTGGDSPEFNNKVKIEIVENKNDSYTITFPQAQDDEIVHHYIIEALNDKQEIIFRDTKFSEFYLNSDMPEKLSVNLFGLPSDANVMIRVIAVDSYGNKSPSSLLSNKFTTRSYVVDVNAKLPKADLFDIEFAENGKAKDISPNNMKVISSFTSPKTFFNARFDRYSAEFNGKNTCYYKINYDNNNALKTAFYSEFSLETVFKTNDTRNICPLSAQEYGGAGIEQASGGHIQFWAYIDNKYKKILPSYVLKPGEYYHVVAIKDAEKMHLYVNGQKIGETDAKGKIELPSSLKARWFCIGGDAANNDNTSQFCLNGDVVIARMYGKVLSRDEVYLLYNSAFNVP